MKSSFEIAVLPGAGIGVDVTAEAVRLLGAVSAGNDALSLSYREVSVGAGECLRRVIPCPNLLLMPVVRLMLSC